MDRSAYAHGTPDGTGIAPTEYADDMALRVSARITAALAVHLDVQRLGAAGPFGGGRFPRNNPGFDITAASLRRRITSST